MRDGNQICYQYQCLRIGDIIQKSSISTVAHIHIIHISTNVSRVHSKNDTQVTFQTLYCR